MSYLQGLDRQQTQLLPACLDDYVPANAAVRFIEPFVQTLNLQQLGFTRATPAATGRPPYDPAMLLALYIYGYLYRIRSSRRLEAEAARNLELIWLLRGLRPDFKTIADFRKDNRGCFPGVLKQFNLLCRHLDLFGAELVAIDGSKFKAVNSTHRHYSREQLEELVNKVEERIGEYLKELDSQDAQAEGTAGAPTVAGLQEKIAQLKERQDQYQSLLGQLQQTQQTEVSLTDPDSRAMKKVGVGYNVQLAVDGKHDLIVETQVVQAANDLGELAAMALAAKETLGVEQLRVVADAGYHEAGQLEVCEQAGIESYLPRPDGTSGQSQAGATVYPKEAFCYDAAKDCYRCPPGQLLSRQHEGKTRGKMRIYYYNLAACRDCPRKSECTSGRYRRISRLKNEAVVERQAARTAAHPEIVAERKTIVEHVFGTMRNGGHDRFLMRGLEKVQAEFSLSALSYNLRRVLGLVNGEKWACALAMKRCAAPVAV